MTYGGAHVIGTHHEEGVLRGGARGIWAALLRCVRSTGLPAGRLCEARAVVPIKVTDGAHKRVS